MLKPAQLYESQLQQKVILTWNDKKYKWYHSWYNSTVTIQRNDNNEIQLVSVNKEDEVIGFIEFYIDRPTNSVTGVSIINFSDDIFTFGIDVKSAFINIFEKCNFNKINFHVVIGNPVEKQYDKLIKSFGGRIVGIYEDDIRLQDNRLYPRKVYEITRNNYYKTKEIHTTGKIDEDLLYELIKKELDSIGIDYSGKDIYAIKSDNKNEYSIYFMPDNISIGTFSTSTFSFKYINHQFKDQTEIVGDIDLYKLIEEKLNLLGIITSNRTIYATPTKNEDNIQVFIDDEFVGTFSIESESFTSFSSSMIINDIKSILKMKNICDSDLIGILPSYIDNLLFVYKGSIFIGIYDVTEKIFTKIQYKIVRKKYPEYYFDFYLKIKSILSSDKNSKITNLYFNDNNIEIFINDKLKEKMDIYRINEMYEM